MYEKWIVRIEDEIDSLYHEEEWSLCHAKALHYLASALTMIKANSERSQETETKEKAT